MTLSFLHVALSLKSQEFSFQYFFLSFSLMIMIIMLIIIMIIIIILIIIMVSSQLFFCFYKCLYMLRSYLINQEDLYPEQSH